MSLVKFIIKTLALGFIFLILVSSCSYKKTTFDIGSLFDPTWDFSKTTELTFDENYVEIKNGKAQLKPLDLKHEGDDFNNGNHVGTDDSTGEILLKDSSDKLASHVNEILPLITSNLVGYWRAEGNWIDESLTGAIPTPQNTPTFEKPSPAGEFMGTFDGINQRVDIGDIVNLKPDMVSISSWMKLSDNTISNQYLAGFGNTGFNGYWLGMNGNFVFNAGDGINVARANSGIIPEEGVWYHVVGTHEAGDTKIYINGELKDTRTNVTGVLDYSSLINGFIIGPQFRNRSNSLFSWKYR